MRILLVVLAILVPLSALKAEIITQSEVVCRLQYGNVFIEQKAERSCFIPTPEGWTQFYGPVHNDIQSLAMGRLNNTVNVGYRASGYSSKPYMTKDPTITGSGAVRIDASATGRFISEGPERPGLARINFIYESRANFVDSANDEVSLQLLVDGKIVWSLVKDSFGVADRNAEALGKVLPVQLGKLIEVRFANRQSAGAPPGMNAPYAFGVGGQIGVADITFYESDGSTPAPLTDIPEPATCLSTLLPLVCVFAALRCRGRQIPRASCPVWLDPSPAISPL